MSPQFPCDVKANNDSEVIFDCRGRRLHGVPKGITSNATELNLSENYIQNISADAFSHLVNLTWLSLNKNHGLKSIAEDAFKNLTKLRILELNNNKILSLDKRNFMDVMNVTELRMSKNCYFWNPCGKYVIINSDSFSVLTRLRVLELSFNNLTQVPKGLPTSLETLELKSNRIQNIFEYDFHGLPNLKTLKLQGNCPRCGNAPYPCVPCPNISLSIHPRAFANLTQLESLHLGGNSLKIIETTWFEGLVNLRNLFLSFNLLKNAIVGEVKFLSYLTRLEKLDLSFNFGEKTYPQTINLSGNFSKLVSLRTLHLEALVFQEITSDTLKPLYELKNLSSLNLGTNFIVHSNSTIFRKFSHLKMIYLAENRLYPIPVNSTPRPHQGCNLKSDLSISPFIKPHPKDFSYELSHSLVKQECFDSGRVLILSSNNLFFISPMQFDGYGDIACLNLSRNGFSAALNGTEFSSLPNLLYLDLSFNKIDLAYDYAFKELKKLEVLDLSYNNHYFKAYGITHNLNFLKNLPVLRVLNMSYNSISTLTTKKMWSKSLSELQFSRNNLGTLWKQRDGSYDRLFTNLVNLTILDISFNHIKHISTRVYENLPHSLTILRLRHNLLRDFDWCQLAKFNKLKILDLSSNSLSHVPEIISNFTHTLTTLDLSHNNIFHLSNGLLNGAKSLKTLYLSFNKLTTINQSTLTNNHIETIFLQHNPFHCTCDLLDFIVWIGDNSNHVTIPRLTTQVTCDTPENRRGDIMIFFDINECVNDSIAFKIFIFSSSLIIITMFMATVAHLFYWDASYVLYYLRAKLKGYHSLHSSENVYEAFVTYDTRDLQVSEWVMEHLRVKLEEDEEKHLPLCLEERDWPPGVPLIDNLTQSIQYSRKTLFVLTEAYVKTGTFRLAMYLAHQRLLEENVDVIVLLMLEPVLQHSHFLRLRRRLCGKTVVEWPRTAAAEPWFWQNLKNVILVDNQVMYSKIYSKYFASK
ncbi:toll-like receptor 8 [Myripristis murdjan]|uniref:toll-like receptor 8 n=1 Tax=Myripristis murdjan TaxID=586833 RepID=UPI0011762059|nr:toll-like receptor 8 [Myripristis murdjan]